MPTIVIRDKETFLDLRNHRPDKNVLETVQFGYESFDATYELWSDDPNAALKYLGPSFAPAFMKVHNDYSVYNSAMSAAFVDGSFYLTIRRTNDTTDPARRNASELLLPGGRSVEEYAPLVAFAYNEIIIPCRAIEMLALRRSS